MDHWHTIEEVRLEAIVCCRCPLCYTRKRVVFGTGPAPARLMIVGEGPGADEDLAGTPFVGKSGKT
ncbi:MAG TPA: uracil-DNA glycosylase family protein, partial [Armatimonadota bacterium]|nr:uracil-DNA glycosylase family protein [Armatimonadota bacterium]